MNADPKWLPEAVTLDQLSYSEAVELSFYGAKVIHPKTLRPLQQKHTVVCKIVYRTISKGTTIRDLKSSKIHHSISEKRTKF